MRVTIYQPQYFPRLHYFNRILHADVFVILDSAQYTKSLNHYTPEGKKRYPTFQSTTPIKSASQDNLISVPIKHNGLQSINETQIDYSQKWQLQHLAELKKNYQKAALFPKFYEEIKTLLQQQYDTLADLSIQTILFGIRNIAGLSMPIKELSINRVNQELQNIPGVRLKKIIRDRDLGVKRPDGMQKGTEWTAAICKALNATEYFYGGTAENSYMSLECYKNNGIALVRQDWKCNEYPQQLQKQGFISNLSILDLLLNVERSEAQKILC